MSGWINTGGWIKIHRSLTEHWLAEHPDKLGWWVLLLLKATHEDKKVLVGNQLIELKRGQVVASLTDLAELWQTSKRTAERFMLLLEHDKMLSRCTSRKVSIVTICNYECYQEKKMQERANVRADGEPIGIQHNIKERKEYNYYNNTNPPAHTHVREEQDFINRYRKEGMWQDVALILHQSISDCEQLFDRWVVEYQHSGETHESYKDFKKHFIQWARIAISKESKQENNGNQRKHDDRRGTEVSSSADYFKPL